MKKLLGIVLLTGLLGSSVMAANDCINCQEFSFEDFQQACENPDQFGNQRPPSQIRIECSATHTTWEALESAPIELPQDLAYTAELFSDKYHVSKINFIGEVPEELASCPVYEQVRGEGSVDQYITCDDVEGEVTMEDICIDAIDELVDENPDAIEYESTGETVNLCEEDFH